MLISAEAREVTSPYRQSDHHDVVVLSHRLDGTVEIVSYQPGNVGYEFWARVRSLRVSHHLARELAEFAASVSVAERCRRLILGERRHALAFLPIVAANP